MSDLVTVDDLDFNAIDYFDTNTISWDFYQPPNDPNVWDAEVRLADGPGVSAVFKFTGSSTTFLSPLSRPLILLSCSPLHRFPSISLWPCAALQWILPAPLTLFRWRPETAGLYS